MTANSCPPVADAAVPGCGTGPIGRLGWVLAELAAIYRGVRPRMSAR
jgi:hypothetical protein